MSLLSMKKSLTDGLIKVNDTMLTIMVSVNQATNKAKSPLKIITMSVAEIIL